MQEEKEYLYKYRSLKNFARFVDILMNNRLFASTYTQLDDAMEGRFIRPVGTDKALLNKIKNDKENYYICSLTKNPNSSPMWALYADEHRGCCIELEVTSKCWTRVKVKYTTTMPNIQNSVEDIITTKSKEWEHQDEIRYIRNVTGKEKRYLHIRIKRVIFGLRVKNDEYRLYEKLIKTINKDIEVTRLKWRDSSLGYENVDNNKENKTI